MSIENSTTAAAVAGAVTILVTWAASQFGGVNVPGEVGQAFTLLVTVLFAHFVPDAGVPRVGGNPPYDPSHE